jgi:hypothetical protein
MYATMLVVSVLVFAAAGAIYWRQPGASVFHPATFYLLFHGLVFVLRPIVGWYYGYDNIYQAMGFRPSPWDKTQVLICTNIGLIAFMAVVLWLTRGPFELHRAADGDARAALLRRFWIIAVPLGALAAWSLYWQWNAIAAAVPFSAMDPRTGEQRLVGVSGYFYAAAGLSAPIAAMIAYLGRFRSWALLPAAGFAVLQLGTGGRGYFVAMGVMIVLMFLHDRGRKWPSALVIVAALAAVPVFHAIKTDRGAFLRETLRPGVADKAPERSFDDAPLETMDIANMEFFEFLVWSIPKRTGTYDYFANNLELVTGPIPRALWPGKPVGAPIKRFDLYENTRPIAITYSVPGMGWYNAGYAGVVLWCALFAAIYGAAFRAFARSGRGPLEVMAYAAFLATATIAFRDGSLQSLGRQLLAYGLPVVALALLIRFRRRDDIQAA